ncbi:MAG: branched-chain amino acid aminotransferase [Alphaproteobacteria bacterium]|jgi:branched-chain amino acid aminotransferase|nr:branched-chain amino acid aminotransferase [Alphaproteobacteria bacterium]MBT4083202.1 branched-chain amino acid aminotransferase [Alphaproteobacteria bacterium]MBT4546268.1 branched-chain amino acid aminotransferase [Alphaproteobacteria bacterium]MBT6385272.1 branched-chain amino acid aminotransferase [Alphaproteobacteria bacterium]MBT7747785.1 branched-chain amino acid aminotransferase [Alphaproteobacteria bacterium]
MSSPTFADRDGFIWFNGQMQPWRDVHPHVLSHGLHYGSSVFEGVRAYEGEIFKLGEHTERLFDGTRTLGMKIPFSEAEINQACIDVLAANDITDGYLRPVAWRGSEMMAISAQDTQIHVAIAAWPWPQYFSPESRLQGISLKTAEWRRPPPESAPVFAKAAGLYMICTMSKHAAEAEGYQDSLMLDWRGQVAECTGANIFFVFDGVIHTPTPDCFLDGITRRTTIDLARARGYKIVERAIMPEEIKDAEEIFITGTAVEVTPISKIDDMTFKVQDITRNLMNDYDSLVRKHAIAAE